MQKPRPEGAPLERRLRHAEYRLEVTAALLDAVLRHLPESEIPALREGLVEELAPLLARAPRDLPRIEDEVVVAMLMQATDGKGGRAIQE